MICEFQCADALYGCMPQADKDVFVHVVDMKPMYPAPTDNTRLMFIYDSLCLPSTFAFISSKRLPKVSRI